MYPISKKAYYVHTKGIYFTVFSTNIKFVSVYPPQNKMSKYC